MNSKRKRSRKAWPFSFWFFLLNSNNGSLYLTGSSPKGGWPQRLPLGACGEGKLAQLTKRSGVSWVITGSRWFNVHTRASTGGGAIKKALAKASAFFNEIRLRRVKYGFAMWNSYAVKYLLRKCEEANFISHRTDPQAAWDISQFSQENYFTFGNAEYFTKFTSCIFVLWAPKMRGTRSVPLIFCFSTFEFEQRFLILNRQQPAGRPNWRSETKSVGLFALLAGQGVVGSISIPVQARASTGGEPSS